MAASKRHGDGKCGFWTPRAAVFVLFYLLLWWFAGFLSLNYYDHYLAKLAQHASVQVHASAPAAPAATASAPTPTHIRALLRAFTGQASRDGAGRALDSFGFRSFFHEPAPAPATAAAGHAGSATLATTLPATFPAEGTDAEQHAFLSRTLDARLHPAQELNNSLFKITIVVVVSVLWIVTFAAANHFTQAWMREHRSLPRAGMRWVDRRVDAVLHPLGAWLRPRWIGLAARVRAAVPGPLLRAWRGVARVVGGARAYAHDLIGAPAVIKTVFGVASIVPILPFAIAMHQEYEPAVFVMALVAIFVAGEHYGGLTETGHELKESTAMLQSRLGTVLDADGLNEWRTEVYQLYATATYRIDAVIRWFDIDAQWWKCAAEPDRWEAYRTRCEDDDTSLWHTLKTCGAAVQFVANLPPRPIADATLTPAEAEAKFFRDLLGLTWHLVLFDDARRYRLEQAGGAAGTPPYLRIKIAHAPCWMHVVDDTIYQVIERGTSGNSTVRKLSESITDPAARLALERWARDSVRTLARRGGRAEEYVFALMRRAAAQAGCADDAPLDAALDAILGQLGLQAYLRQPKADFLLAASDDIDPRMNRSVLLSEDTATASCRAVFQEFIAQRFARNACQIPAWAGAARQVRHLASETL